MFDKLVEFLVDCIGVFKFWEIVDPYERGIVIRLGLLHREIGPGFHWLIPFKVDRALLDNVVTRTSELHMQTLTMRDGSTISVAGIIRYNIRDVKKALLEVENLDHVLVDCVFGNVSHLVRAAKWEDLPTPEFGENLTRICRKQAWRYGVEVENVVFSDLCRSKAIALVKS